MEREDLIKLRNGFEELVNILDEILSIEETEENEKLMEEKVAMFVYKIMKVSHIGD